MHFFLQKSAHHQEDFFKIYHFKTSRQKNPDLAIPEFFFDKEPGYMLRNPQEKTLQLLVPKSKRLGGYTQMGVLFSSKRYTSREDLMKCYTVSLKKALGRRLFLLGKT